MNLALLLAIGVVVVFLGIAAIVVALILALRRHPVGESTTGGDTMWIAIRAIVIALVCCLAAGMAAECSTVCRSYPCGERAYDGPRPPFS